VKRAEKQGKKKSAYHTRYIVSDFPVTRVDRFRFCFLPGFYSTLDAASMTELGFADLRFMDAGGWWSGT
jgi:hypothetical protein